MNNKNSQFNYHGNNQKVMIRKTFLADWRIGSTPRLLTLDVYPRACHWLDERHSAGANERRRPEMFTPRSRRWTAELARMSCVIVCRRPGPLFSLVWIFVSVDSLSTFVLCRSLARLGRSGWCGVRKWGNIVDLWRIDHCWWCNTDARWNRAKMSLQYGVWRLLQCVNKKIKWMLAYILMSIHSGIHGNTEMSTIKICVVKWNGYVPTNIIQKKI